MAFGGHICLDRKSAIGAAGFGIERGQLSNYRGPMTVRSVEALPCGPHLPRVALATRFSTLTQILALALALCFPRCYTLFHLKLFLLFFCLISLVALFSIALCFALVLMAFLSAKSCSHP